MTELRRRNVFRVAIAYLIIAWLILQVGDTLAPALRLDEWVNTVAVRALEIDDRLAEALAAVYWQMDWKFLEAEKAFKRAIELNPNHSRTLVYYAWMLGETGRSEEAMVPARRAQELDPLSISANVAVAEALYHSRNFDEAIKEYSKNLDLSPNEPAVHYCPSSNKWNRSDFSLSECFAHHFHVMRRTVTTPDWVSPRHKSARKT